MRTPIVRRLAILHLTILSVCAVVGAVVWPYTINTWLVFLHREPVIIWWQGAILGFIPGIGQLTLPAAVLTWLAMILFG